MKKQTKLLIISLSVFLIMYATLIFDASAPTIAHRFLNNEPNFRAAWQERGYNNILSIIFIYPIRFNEAYRLDRIESNMIWGTFLFQLIIPFIAALAGVFFYDEHYSINQFIYPKADKRFTVVIKEAAKEASLVALAVFIGFSLYWLLNILLLKDYPNLPGSALGGHIFARDLFVELFGRGFYIKFPGLYFLLEGAARFFLIPFIYGFTTCVIAIFVKSKRVVYLIGVGIYIMLSAIPIAFSRSFIGSVLFYINPGAFMASGTFYDVVTIFFLLGVSMPAIIAAIALHQKKELY